MTQCASDNIFPDTCHDIFKNCDRKIEQDPDYCNTEDAFRQCHKTCNLCEPGTGGGTSVSTPDPFATAQPSGTFISYHWMGQQHFV